MDAQTMAGTRDRLKDKVGWLAYVASGALTLVQPGFQVRASVDGRRPVITLSLIHISEPTRPY